MVPYGVMMWRPAEVSWVLSVDAPRAYARIDARNGATTLFWPMEPDTSRDSSCCDDASS